MTFRRVVISLRGPGQSPVLPFACCVGSLLSVGRCGRCSCWCRFRVRGAQWVVCWGCAGCDMVCLQRGGYPPPPFPPGRPAYAQPLSAVRVHQQRQGGSGPLDCGRWSGAGPWRREGGPGGRDRGRTGNAKRHVITATSTPPFPPTRPRAGPLRQPPGRHVESSSH